MAEVTLREYYGQSVIYYAPNAAFTGVDTLTYRITDGRSLAEGTVFIGQEGPVLLLGDFDKNGRVEFADFFMFSDRFGARLGDDLYDGLYDLDSDGEVGFGDFFLFADSFGKEVDE